MSVDIGHLEAHELASPGRWHVLMRNPVTMDVGDLQLIAGQSSRAIDWPMLRRIYAGLGHELLAARREDGVTVPAGDHWLVEARACTHGRALLEPWASLLAPPSVPEPQADEAQSDEADGDEPGGDPTTEPQADEAPKRKKKRG